MFRKIFADLECSTRSYVANLNHCIEKKYYLFSGKQFYRVLTLDFVFTIMAAPLFQNHAELFCALLCVLCVLRWGQTGSHC